MSHASSNSKCEKKDTFGDDEEEDSMRHAFTGLKLKDKPCAPTVAGRMNLFVNRLHYCGVKKDFPKELCAANLSVDQMEAVIGTNCGFDAEEKSLPLLRQLDNEFTVTVEIKNLPPALKPSLLIASLALATNHHKNHNPNGSAAASISMSSVLSGIQFIGARNIFKNLVGTLFSPSDRDAKPRICRMNFCKLTRDGPIFIERTEYYDEVEGSVGKLFKQHFLKTRSEKFQRWYVLNQVTVVERSRDNAAASGSRRDSGAWTVVTTNEVDGINSGGHLVELTTKPDFKEHDIMRLAQKWFQAVLGGVDRIIYGSFESAVAHLRPKGSPWNARKATRVTQPKGSPWKATRVSHPKSSPWKVTSLKSFKLSKIQNFTLCVFEKLIPEKIRENMLHFFYNCLDIMQKECKVLQQVYELRYDGEKKTFEIKIAENTKDKEFPINETLLKTAEKVINGNNDAALSLVSAAAAYSNVSASASSKSSSSSAAAK